MASPQKGNGFTPIANEIMTALARTRISGEARQLLDVIIRQTYGWNRLTTAISLVQFSKLTGISKTHVCRGLNKLLSMSIITKKGNATSHFTKRGSDFDVSYGFQKDFDKWVTLPKKVVHVTQKGNVHVTQKGNPTLPKKGKHSLYKKERKDKERIKKGKIQENEFESFYIVYPKKKAKKEAYKAWLKCNGNRPPLDELLTILEEQKQTKDWQKEGGLYVPHPATWLNGKRWEDQIEKNDTPYQEIMSVFCDVLPELPETGNTTQARNYMNIFWKHEKVHKDMSRVRDYFQYVKKSHYLMGTKPGAGFRADFEWLIEPDNYSRIASGKYHG